MIDRAPEVDPVVVQAEFREPRHPGALWGLPRLQNLARRAAELHPEAPGLEVLNVIVEVDGCVGDLLEDGQWQEGVQVPALENGCNFDLMLRITLFVIPRFPSDRGYRFFRLNSKRLQDSR